MSFSALADRVHETSLSIGTGNITLLGAEAGCQAIHTGVGLTTQTDYAIVSRTGGQWEVGRGQLSDNTTLTRTTVVAGSNGTTHVNFGAGTKDVYVGLSAATIADIIAAIAAKLSSVSADTLPALGGNLTIGTHSILVGQGRIYSDDTHNVTVEVHTGTQFVMDTMTFDRDTHRLFNLIIKASTFESFNDPAIPGETIVWFADNEMPDGHLGWHAFSDGNGDCWIIAAGFKAPECFFDQININNSGVLNCTGFSGGPEGSNSVIVIASGVVTVSANAFIGDVSGCTGFPIDVLSAVLAAGNDAGGADINNVANIRLPDAGGGYLSSAAFTNGPGGTPNAIISVQVGGPTTISSDLMSSSEGYYVAGTQVVGSQQASIADSSDLTVDDYRTTINAILAALRAHGLIAT